MSRSIQEKAFLVSSVAVYAGFGEALVLAKRALRNLPLAGLVVVICGFIGYFTGRPLLTAVRAVYKADYPRVVIALTVFHMVLFVGVILLNVQVSRL
ncbi:MAG TPA: hypothetical protein VEF76_12805 [Patescibacteria group bacterium]|nr:hypothetical protein [Patescibacteria group bacterium]